VSGLNQSWIYPISYFVGNGSGGLWYSDVDLGSGLNAENFRSDGGVHHIHIELISLLYRHGIIGVGIYITWISYICISAYKTASCFQNNSFLRSASVALLFVHLCGFLTMLTNTSLYGHFYIPFLSSFVIVIRDRLKHNALA